MIQAAAHALKLLAELSCLRSHRMGVEILLVLPHFRQLDMIRSTALLQHIKTHTAGILAAGLTVLPEQSGSLTRGWWHDFDIGHHVDGSNTRFIGAWCLREAQYGYSDAKQQ